MRALLPSWLGRSAVVASAAGTGKTKETPGIAALFDVDFYRASNPDVAAAGTDPLEHYRLFGWRENRNPHPLFDLAFYRGANPDVAAADADPLEHYLTSGWKEGRNPHPLFDVAFYRESNPDVAAADVEPFGHYLTSGWKEGRDPHPLFSVRFYQDSNPDVAAAGVEPLGHYLASGWKEGRDPHPLFETDVYRGANPDVAAEGVNPLVHYAFFGRREERTATRIAPVAGFSDRETAADLLPFALPRPAAPEVSVPEVSVIVPVHGKLDLTVRCLHALSRHRSRHGFEVVVVDDGSDAETRDGLARIDGLVLHRNEQAGGFIEACNRGAELASGRYLLFLNNDTVVLDGWLDELVDAFAVLPQAGAVGSALIYPSGRLQEAGAVVWRDGTAANLGRNRDPQNPAFCHAREVDYCSGASLMVPADLFRRLGGFDRRYAPAYYEDSDLCLRIREAGFRVYCQPLSAVVHIEGGTAGTDPSQGMKRFQAVNRATFAERWAPLLATLPASHPIDAHRLKRPGQRRVLVIDHDLPHPNADAGSVVTMEMIRLFQRLGYAVVFAAVRMPQGRGDDVRALERLGVEVVRAPYFTSAADYVEGYGDSCDLVFMVRYVVAAMILPHIGRLAVRPKTILLNADLHYLRAERQAALYNDAALAVAAVEEKAAELATLRAVDATITHSDVEREILRVEAPGTLVEVLPWIARPVEDAPGPAGRRDILFVGGFGHAPNVDAMVAFVVNLWPRLRARLPGARLRIAGSHAGAAVHALKQEDVLVLGHVEDLRAEMDRARVSIAPLRWGAGLKGKVATAMAFGLPSVISPIAAESMGLVDGRDALIAELDDAFVEAVARLYEDDALWTDVARNGRDFVARHWSPERGLATLRHLMTRAKIPPTHTISDQIEAMARQRAGADR
ncbi:glycosyltransferase [Azospirillum canadense]|uniref:glycosyltransferase n=1 Tax=Azospirillum canadense TaxID=403962 RepID=UPI002226A0A1|nr:glycosyltransferase [Azospirillum canadense]MCW2240850.1 GT2 family glycosyltransferase/glycosyltransferase involved in cell wall biosynthesis [Azospirillum canadense]